MRDATMPAGVTALRRVSMRDAEHAMSAWLSLPYIQVDNRMIKEIGQKICSFVRVVTVKARLD
jgi:hypothetical protein